MYTKLDLIYSFKNCIDDCRTECFKYLTQALKKNHRMDSKTLLYGKQCSFESMPVLMILVTLYLQHHTPFMS